MNNTNLNKIEELLELCPKHSKNMFNDLVMFIDQLTYNNNNNDLLHALYILENALHINSKIFIHELAKEYFEKILIITAMLHIISNNKIQYELNIFLSDILNTYFIIPPNIDNIINIINNISFSKKNLSIFNNLDLYTIIIDIIRDAYY
jgi:hypothetical protein